MLKRIQSFFNQQIDTATSDGGHGEHALALATAALLFEVTRADFEVLDVEREAVESAIQKIFFAY